MIDRRCRHKIREVQDFYLFKKHGFYYYAYYPKQKVTRSTGEKDIQDAYKKAWDILPTLEDQNFILFKPLDTPKKNRELKRALKYFDQNKNLTKKSILDFQKKMSVEGLSPKSINNYVYLLASSYSKEFPEWTPLKYNPVYRSCYPIKSFYGFYSKCDSRLKYLAFIAMTTGARAGELSSMETIVKGDRYYLKINGTKTRNAIRTIPALKETIDSLDYLKGGFASSSYKEAVREAGKVYGFDDKYIEENHIVFHGFRKMYKTLLESCNINNNWVEYYLGHSQTRTVNQLYFIGSSADDDDVYDKVIDALRRFL